VLDQLAIINLRQDAREHFPVCLNGLEWKTCLRRVLFLNTDENQDLIAVAKRDQSWARAVDVYHGDEAPQFLLEVICGLNSPLVGETAVMGQFREFLGQARFPNTSWGIFLRQLTSNLLAEAKRVRHDHLQGLGSQSYGSLVRSHVKDLPMVSVLGAGQLAREILPWLIGKTKVRVFYRNWDHAKELLNDYPEIELLKFSDTADGGGPEGMGLVIAAPLSAAAVAKWVSQQGSSFSKCLDLRGEAETDPLTFSLRVIRLSELFEALRNDRQKLEGRVAAARAEINLLCQRQMHQAQFRPFGWEDLCA